MPIINAKRKGNTYERKVCKILSLYFPGKFERRSMGIKGADVICSDDGFPYATEAKHQKGIKAIHLLVGNSQIDKWWQQAKEQAGRVNKKPLLVARVERHDFCTIDGNKWHLFDIWCSMNGNRK